jgi:lysozyme family protein
MQITKNRQTKKRIKIMAKKTVQKTYENVIRELAGEYAYVVGAVGVTETATQFFNYLQNYDFKVNRSSFDIQGWGGCVPV